MVKCAVCSGNNRCHALKHRPEGYKWALFERDTNTYQVFCSTKCLLRWAEVLDLQEPHEK